MASRTYALARKPVAQRLLQHEKHTACLPLKPCSQHSSIALLVRHRLEDGLKATFATDHESSSVLRAR